MHSPLQSAILGAALIALCSSVDAFAQTMPPADPGNAPHHMMRDAGAEHSPWMHRDPAEMQKHAADHLRTMLQLTPQQEPALQTFLASMKPPEDKRRMDMAAARGVDAKPDPAKFRAEMDKRHVEMDAKRKAEMAMTTPQRLDMLMKHMAEREAKMQAHITSVKTFYAALSPPQQKVFDTLHGAWMRRGFGGRGHDSHGPDRPGRGDMHMGMGGPMPPPLGGER